MPSLDTRPNLLSPELRANPFPLYSELRTDSPVQELEPGGIFAVSRYDDVMYILNNPELFSSMGFEKFLKPQWLSHNPIPIVHSNTCRRPAQPLGSSLTSSHVCLYYPC